MEPLRSRTCSFSVDGDGFVRAIIDDLADMTVEDAREALAVTARLAAGKKVGVLVDSRRLRSQTREAREFFAGEEAAAVCQAVAILVGSPVSRVIGNFFLDRSDRAETNRLFSDEGAAIAWLRERTR